VKFSFSIFTLQAEGWYTEIVPKKPRKDGQRPDWAWPPNPPYRSYIAQNVSVSNGFTPEDVIEYGPREFRFPLDEADAERALRLYEKLESSDGQTVRRGNW